MPRFPQQLGRRPIAVWLVGVLIASLSACAPGPSAAPSAVPTGNPASAAPSPAAPTIVAATPAASRGPDPTLPPGPLSAIYRTWTRIDMPASAPRTYGGTLPDDVTWFSGRFVAVGGVNAGCCDAGFSEDTRALVWRSRDGSDWNLLPNADAFDLGHMSAVAAGPDRIVAIGYLARDSQAYPGSTDPAGAAWVSDDGATWDLVTDIPGFSDVVASDDGFIAVENAGRAPAIWHSADGVTWDRVAAGSELGDGVINRIIRDGEGFLGVGTSVNIAVASGSRGAVVWRSSNGRDWTRVADQAGLGAGFIEDVAVGAGTYVAVGNARGPGGAIWISTDGVSWRRHTDPVLNQQGLSISHVLAGSDGLLALGTRPGADGFLRSAAWASTDGLAWAWVPEQEALGWIGVALAGWVEAENGALLAVGRRWDEIEGALPVAWLIR